MNNVEARARVAQPPTAAVKAAQAALESIMQNGTVEQRQAATADVARDKIERDQAQRDLAALKKLSADWSLFSQRNCVRLSRGLQRPMQISMPPSRAVQSRSTHPPNWQRAKAELVA